MKPLITIAAAAFVAAAIIPAAAAADPRHCPPGHAKQGRCFDDFRERDRIFFDGRYYDDLEDAYEAGYRDGSRDAYWRAGQRLPGDVDVIVIRDYDRYGLQPPRPGYYYGQVNGELLLIEAATRMIAQALTGY